MYSVEFAYKIVPSGEAEAGLGNPLIRQLAAIECGEGLQQAARSLGVSYRYFWGEIEAWEAKFGQKLVIREQGRRADCRPWAQSFFGPSAPSWRTMRCRSRRCAPNSMRPLPPRAIRRRKS